MFDKNIKKKMHFSDFLTGEYARDYINQNLSYSEQIERAAKLRDIYLQIENLVEKQTVVMPKDTT